MGYLSLRDATSSVKNVLNTALIRCEKLRYLTAKKIINTAVNTIEAKLQLPTVHSLPQNVDVVLTTKCNLACVFCKAYDTSGAKYLSIENFEKVARQLFPTARLLSICSGGEPYLHKGLEDVLRIAHSYRVPTWVLSNGMLLKEERIRTIVREELISQHGFSVDGIKASTVEALRLNAKLDRILENIEMLISIREDEGKKEPTIVIRYILMRCNIEELPDAISHWGATGINVIDCNYLSLCNDIDKQESLYFHQDLMEKVFAEARQIAADYPRLVVNLPPTIRQQQALQDKPRNCESLWDFVCINADGQVFPCYCTLGVLNMGNIFDGQQSFKKIWNDPHYQDLRRTANNDTLKKHYAYCSGCETRFGWGDLKVHLGDETWLKRLPLDEEKRARVIAKRRRKGKAR